MTSVYDNWERLVKATLDREELRQLALLSSRDTSFNSSISSGFNSPYNFQPDSLTDRVIKAAEVAATFKQECAEVKSKTEKLAGLLRRASIVSNVFYDRPTRRIIADTELVLEKALALVLRCSQKGIKRFFKIIPADAFQKMSSQLENAIQDVSWLLYISASTNDEADEHLIFPPITINEPILCLVWEQITTLYTGSLEDRSDAAASLASLARGDDRHGKMIVEEGGVGSLLKLVEEGILEGQENAIRAIGWLGKDPESVEHMIQAGVCEVFVEMIKEGPMKVQAVVAWAMSEFAMHYPKCQNLFAQHDIVQLLVGHLAFETVHDVVTTGLSNRSREIECPATKAHMKAMAARALWQLAVGNSTICRSITESRGIICLALLLEEGPEEVQYNSASALMEITAMAAEKDAALRISALDPNSPDYKALVDQLFRVVEEGQHVTILNLCIQTIVNLATSCKTADSRMISLLAKLLDQRDTEVSRDVFFTRGGPSPRCLSIDGTDTSSRRSSSSAPLTPRNLKSFGFNDLRIATGNFRPDTVLGEGSFGCVFKGWIDEHIFKAAKPGTGMVIAVKRLNQESFQGHKEWLTEINYLGQLYHPNLVKLIGYCLEDEHRLLVYEFMPRGSLENHLFRRASYFQPLSWKLRMKVALDAAKGVAYLHSPKARVIYRDFKSSNILLDSNYNAKLSDFGLAKDGPLDGKSHVSTSVMGHVSTRVMGTYGYAAPEYVATGHLTASSDVYSFGVVLLEMLTGRRLLDKNRPHGEQNLIEWARPYLASKRRVLRVMDARLEGQYSPGGALRAATLAVKCLAVEPKYRPTMTEVVKALEQLQDSGSVKTEEAAHRNRQDSSRKNASYPRPSVASPMVA